MGCLFGVVLAAGCSTPFTSYPTLSYSGPRDALAVGSLASFGVIYVDSNATCGALCTRVHIGIQEHVSAESSDPNVLEVLKIGDTVAVRALHEGKTTLTLRAIDTQDLPVERQIPIEVLAPDRLSLAPRCDTLDKTGLLPVGGTQVFDFEAALGDRRLYARGLPLAEDPGALVSKGIAPSTPEIPTEYHVYDTPGAPVETAVTLSHEGLSAVAAVRVYDLPEVSGLSLAPSEAGPWGLHEDVYVGRRLSVDGTPVCADPIDRWPMSVTIETPGVCVLPDHESQPEVPSILGTTVRVWGTSPGTCVVTVHLDGTGLTASTELVFQDGAGGGGSGGAGGGAAGAAVGGAGGVAGAGGV